MEAQLSFEDWKKNKIWNQKNYRGEYVCNDSENYLYLIANNQMTYEELNKIQNAQIETYEYIVGCSLELNERFFSRKAAKSLDQKRVVQIQIDTIQKYFDNNSDLYYEILLPREHRGMKYGAKFIVPDQYLAYKKQEFIDIATLRHAPYTVKIEGKMVRFPTPEQAMYLDMEVKFHWQNLLKSKIQTEPITKGQHNDMLQLREILTEAGYKLIPELFEDLEITVNGKFNLTPGRAGKLMATIVAMKETPGIFKIKFPDEKLLRIFNNYIGTSYKTFSKRSQGYDEAYDDAKKFIKTNFKK